MNTKLKLKRIFVDSDIEYIDAGRYIIPDPFGGATGWSQAEQLASEGWELVGSVPVIKGMGGYSVTNGYILLFKHPY